MKNNYAFFLILIALVLISATSGCSKKKVPRKVYISKTEGKYSLIRNGKPFFIKGAGGISGFDLLSKVGANTVRLWDTTRLETVLNNAHKHNLAVIVGLPMPESTEMYFYNDTVETNLQFKAFKALINKYKGHPSILMWCVGNELGFENKLSNLSFFSHFNRIVRMIHEDDPDHPVTTTWENLQRRIIITIAFRTDVDIISLNIFNSLPTLRKDIERLSAFWDGPYLLTEWASGGPWEGTKQTAWGAYIEPSSSDKANNIIKAYKNYLPTDDSRFLGSLLFYWGQKQETTHTWFSMFDESGSKTESVYAAEYLWTGKTSQPLMPRIKEIRLNQQVSDDNIILQPGSQINASLTFLAKSSNPVKIKWELYKEDWYKKDGKSSTKRLKPLQRAIITGDSASQLKSTAPTEAGPYRLFATAYNNKGDIATCNIPFYILEKR